ncbi:MAG: arylsulfatase [Phycisphaeraceae bacterium]|nr:arylsulfatase [Phycisphaeraceae bacterium]
MRPTLVFLALAAALTLVTAAQAQSPPPHAPSRPHIVHIVADDLGWKDVGYHGSDIKTPNIDRLAATGATLGRFYAQPMCTPTRACLMTGRYPFRYGLQTAVILGTHTYGLPTDEWLLPQALKDAGYETAIIGKWHLGHADRATWPRQRGFDYQYGPLIGEIDYFKHESGGINDWFRNNEPLKEEGYSTTLIGDDAVRHISEHDPATPLYLYLTFNAPHSPYQAPQEYIDRFPDIKEPTRRIYAGMVSAMDDQIGRVVAALEAKGMRDNTLILFHSDNGGVRNAMFAGEVDVSQMTIPCDNGPYREGKGTLYEGGTLVCALANWPGHIKASQEVDGMIHAVDLYPTLARLAGASTSNCKPLDGLDVWPTISEGKPSPRTEIVYNIEPFRAGVRQGDWKLVWRTPLPSVPELYNLAADPHEKTNVAPQHPEIVAALERRANELAASMVNPKFLETEFAALRERVSLPPALPGQEYDLEASP